MTVPQLRENDNKPHRAGNKKHEKKTQKAAVATWHGLYNVISDTNILILLI